MRNQHADTNGLKALRERLASSKQEIDEALLDQPCGPEETGPVTRAEYTSLCNRLSRVEAALRQVARMNQL